MKQIIVSIAFLITFINAQAQKLDKQVDNILHKVYHDPSGPGGAFLVAQNGKVIYKKAFGKANLELNVPLTTDHVFQLGSITKQFTAISILMLEEMGKLSIDSPISDYIPDFPNGKHITIHHLLTHTSGIKDFTKLKSINQIAEKDLSPAELVNSFKNEPADYPPGQRFEYNNSGYVILGYLIEILSGETYREFVEHHIFKTLGMKNSYYASDREIRPNRAYGYQKKDNNYVNKTKISFNIPYAAGSLMSTLDDMLIWQNALNSHPFLSEGAKKKAFTIYQTTDGKLINYGYGWHLVNYENTPVREHGGSIFGFKSMGVFVPEKNIYIIGLSNCDAFSPTQAARDIAKVAIKALH